MSTDLVYEKDQGFDSHPATKKAGEGWVAEERPEPKVWEIGRAFEGCADEPEVIAKQRDVLQQIIDAYGIEFRTYDQVPEIRSHHNHDAHVGLLDFGRKIVVDRMPCQWAAYARVISFTQPEDWYVPEGTRIPVEQ